MPDRIIYSDISQQRPVSSGVLSQPITGTRLTVACLATRSDHSSAPRALRHVAGGHLQAESLRDRGQVGEYPELAENRRRIEVDALVGGRDVATRERSTHTLRGTVIKCTVHLYT